MIQYTGRNKQVAYVPNKPIDTGFKVWIAARLGLFIRWIWHQPGAKYGPVGVQKKPALQRKKSKGKARLLVRIIRLTRLRKLSTWPQKQGLRLQP
jgi:hypothetical protein